MHQKAHHIDDNENDADNDGDGYDEDDNDGSIENTAPENKPPGELLARSRIGSPIHELTPLHISQQYIMLWSPLIDLHLGKCARGPSPFSQIILALLCK